MQGLSRELSSREKTLMVILILIVFFVCYFKFILTPINDGVDNYQMMAAAQEDDFLINFQKSTQVKTMEDEIEAIKASGDVKPLPQYDNSKALLTQLRSILDGNLDEYSMQFGALVEYDYLVCRPLDLTFNADSYITARRLIDQISSQPTVQQITNLDIQIKQTTEANEAGETELTDEVEVYMTVNYYEFKK